MLPPPMEHSPATSVADVPVFRASSARIRYDVAWQSCLLRSPVEILPSHAHNRQTVSDTGAAGGGGLKVGGGRAEWSVLLNDVCNLRTVVLKRSLECTSCRNTINWGYKVVKDICAKLSPDADQDFYTKFMFLVFLWEVR